MSERDELRVRLLSLGGSISAGWRGLDVAGQFDQEKAEAVVDATMEVILAAGYRKPRIITTAEELDALPVGSVILDQVGLSLHRNAFTGWCSSNGAKEIPMDMLMQEALPATVLYEGAQS